MIAYSTLGVNDMARATAFYDAVFAPLGAVRDTSSPTWTGYVRAGDKGGVGINRVRLGVHTGLFPFRTREAVSVVDGGPCVAIDYDVPTNPAAARPIYDEVRCIHPGLYLGRGMSRRPGREPKLLLWFALDTRIQDRPVAFRDVR